MQPRSLTRFLFATGLGIALAWTPGAPPALADEPSPSDRVERRVYDSQRAEQAPTIDGHLDDAAWRQVEWSGDFLQRDPEEGVAPSQQTRFKVVYDDDAIYFAFELDDDPALVSRQLARRDWFPGDWIEVNIDSYFDHRTAFSFTLSLSGARGDEYISNDGSRWDSNWDPVWEGSARVTPQGWAAEMRIPLGQLRFSAADEQIWGLQINRRVFRLEERSSWQRIPRDVAGWVSQFGELRGLRGLEPKRNVELVPYFLAGAERFEAEPGNPFRDGSASNFEGGLDGKVGVSNNLTLDFTVNPDFGQVEADPSEVNLTAFETFFDERRPFFIEGNDIFDLRLAPAMTGGPFTADRLFYSRRIGRSPSHSPALDDGEFIDAPGASTILGALKLSGKTAGGLSVGVLASVTEEETATIALGDARREQVVEPLTTFFVGRLRQDYRDGDTQIGGIVTAVDRQLDDPELSFLRDRAVAGGFDLSHYFHQRDYRFEASVMASEITGSPEAILDAQTSSARFFQRPDNGSADLDPTRTSLSGHAGSFRLTRTNNHKLVFQTGVAWRSPGFEINDLGFLRSADGIDQFTWVAYQQRRPIGVFDQFNINGNQRLGWDFDGEFLGSVSNVNGWGQFRNKWNAFFGITRESEQRSNTELRGGPSSRWPGSWVIEGNFGTDRRKDLRLSLGGFQRWGDAGSEDTSELWAELRWQPTDAIRIRLRPSHVRSERELQYIDTVTVEPSLAGSAFGPRGPSKTLLPGDRFLFGTIDQETTSLTLRLDYSITPDLTVQLYASPFVSNGRYRELKRITDPRASGYTDRFEVFGDDRLGFDDGTFAFDEDGDGTPDYSLGDPDFDFRELNTNLVIRWEYRPGSAVFLVWSQVRDETTLVRDDLGYRRDLDRLFSAPAHNVVLLKVSKWFAP